jgi:hypothetical protein
VAEAGLAEAPLASGTVAAGFLGTAQQAQRLLAAGPHAPRYPVLPHQPLPANPMDLVPADAGVRRLTPDSHGGAQYGVEFTWYQGDQRVTLRMHGPDGTAPPGSNAATGDVYRLALGGRYLDLAGQLYAANVHNPGSPHYDPVAANDTHPRWPAHLPYPWSA